MIECENCHWLFNGCVKTKCPVMCSSFMNYNLKSPIIIFKNVGPPKIICSTDKAYERVNKKPPFIGINGLQVAVWPDSHADTYAGTKNLPGGAADILRKGEIAMKEQVVSYEYLEKHACGDWCTWFKRQYIEYHGYENPADKMPLDRLLRVLSHRTWNDQRTALNWLKEHGALDENLRPTGKSLVVKPEITEDMVKRWSVWESPRQGVCVLLSNRDDQWIVQTGAGVGGKPCIEGISRSNMAVELNTYDFKPRPDLEVKIVEKE